MTPTTALYVPGSRPDRFDKAVESGADAVVLDLEDAVAADEKTQAREAVATWLEGRAASAVEVWVRVNHDDALLADDIAAVASAGITGWWLPKTERAEDVDRVVELTRAARGSDPLPVSPLIESGAGVAAAVQIAGAAHVCFLQLGEQDLAADLGITPQPEGHELAYARGAVVVASAAAGLEPPLGAVSIETVDLESLAADTRRLRHAGFHGRGCIHPRQLAPVAAVFEPSAEERAWAHEILSLMERGAVATDARGHLVDEAVARRARRILGHIGPPGTR